MSVGAPAPEFLRARLGTLRAALGEDQAALEGLRAVQARKAVLDVLGADLDRQIERVRHAAVITLVGATGAGKSTLLNAMVGRPIALEGTDRPTTRKPVIHAPHDADLGELLAGIASEQGGDREPAVVVRHDAAAGGPWAGQILIDAPDLNSVAAAHRAVVTALAERSDVLVVVLHRQSIVEEASVSFIDAYRGRRRLLFVLNRADELTPDSRQELLAQIRRLADTRWQAPEATVLSLSARSAQTQPHAAGWAEFCRTLHDLVHESAITGARRLNALGTVARLQEEFAAVADEAGEDLERLPDEAGGGAERFAARLGEEIAARFALRRADLNGLLWEEAAKRWDGPGGWALRVGSLGSLGLGAGALLLRRSPLLAAGAAAGSLAADSVQRAGRQQRTDDATGLLPERGDFTAWYAAAFAQARVRASRLTGDPETLGIPAAEIARGEAALAVEESWSELAARDLPAAAAHSALRYFHLPLDLPVYALGAWVVYRVAVGFFAGRYQGLDFLVNAVLLLGAYLFLVRLLVRRVLNTRAGGLLSGAVGRVRAVLAARTDETRRRVHERCDIRRQALARLRGAHAAWQAGVRDP